MMHICLSQLQACHRMRKYHKCGQHQWSYIHLYKQLWCISVLIFTQRKAKVDVKKFTDLIGILHKTMIIWLWGIYYKFVLLMEAKTFNNKEPLPSKFKIPKTHLQISYSLTLNFRLHSAVIARDNMLSP